MNEAIENILQSKDIAPTAMRILVLEYLQKQTAAVNLADVEAGFAQADRITIYRTLKTFEEKGLIHSINDGTESTKYALCAEACKAGDHYDLHLHFFCIKCRQTYCLPKHKVPEIDLPAGYQLKELNLVAKGICDQCT
ncbi:MAG: transcriptional repressor [Chitinophagaceae bacterium]|nr:MAG: transcriptional repressor [Chitinophagaceae bacterium]